MNKAAELQKSRLFEGLLPEEIEMLSELVQLKHYQPGSVIIQQGEVGDSLLLLVTGTVDVIRIREDNTEHTIASIESPGFFGEMSLIDKERRSATIKAQSETSVLCLTNKNLHSFSRVYQNAFTLVVINIARVLSNRLRMTNERLASLM
jgi:CRP-like cAMP-binding protein